MGSLSVSSTNSNITGSAIGKALHDRHQKHSLPNLSALNYLKRKVNTDSKDKTTIAAGNENNKNQSESNHATLVSAHNADIKKMRTQCELNVGNLKEELKATKHAMSEVEDLLARKRNATHAKTLLMEQMSGQLSESREEIRRLKNELDVANHAKALSMEQTSGQLSESREEIRRIMN